MSMAFMFHQVFITDPYEEVLQIFVNNLYVNIKFNAPDFCGGCIRLHGIHFVSHMTYLVQRFFKAL